MDRAFLEGLGLTVRETDGVVEAELELRSGEAINPLTRKMLDRVVFTVLGERMIAIEPPEMVGTPPIHVAHLSSVSSLEELVVKSVNDSLLQLQRRSQELSMLGLSPAVDPTTLLCGAELAVGRFQFTIGSDRMGSFRVVRVARDGVVLTNESVQPFELSEFRERPALEGYLAAMFGEVAAPPPAVAPAPAAGPSAAEAAPAPAPADGEQTAIPAGEVVAAFGTDAAFTPRCQLELVIELAVKGERYRFAAARVMGRTFRGMLAGREGKVWADRFELGEFPGIRALVCTVLKVPSDSIEVLA